MNKSSKPLNRCWPRWNTSILMPFSSDWMSETMASSPLKIYTIFYMIIRFKFPEEKPPLFLTPWTSTMKVQFLTPRFARPFYPEKRNHLLTVVIAGKAFPMNKNGLLRVYSNKCWKTRSKLSTKETFCSPQSISQCGMVSIRSIVIIKAISRFRTSKISNMKTKITWTTPN